MIWFTICIKTDSYFIWNCVQYLGLGIKYPYVNVRLCFGFTSNLCRACVKLNSASVNPVNLPMFLICQYLPITSGRWTKIL